ncbi:AraC family transcriptional regulator [Rhodobacter sp. 24-YEA-8]|uniref:helix-turn-helix domain-containing protein n=1 Tax=Rhodobacter sp. 24-YEA-8 TaxID=1884310 RepID=UPI001C0CF93E|nr:AraC family transcriptional regulator [Rhodobacter sp. 24-YEA-8]
MDEASGRFSDMLISRNMFQHLSLLMLPLIGILMLRLAASAPGGDAIDAGSDEPGPPNPVPNVNDALVLERLTAPLSERRLYRDPDLTLDRLSCRLGIPARQVSGAINCQLGCNVSQAINDWRIREAMRLLLETAAPVTQVMFNFGFQTKSNFNREFRQVAGSAPNEWRQQRRQAAS